MVRLGEKDTKAATRLVICFNSSMVRLGEGDFEFELDGVTFQFQYGAIGSSKEDQRKMLFSSFNSSMVRLGVLPS